MNVFVYKTYNDEYAYGEEKIQVFSTLELAQKELKKDVEEHYGVPFKTIPENEDIFDKEDDNFSENYVSISNGDSCCFWFIEEKTIL